MSAPTDMAAFVRAVELGGFSAAARELQLTPSAISKLVSRLEERLGVRLLNRTTRRLALTPEGEAFMLRSQRIIADIADAEDEVARFRALPRGLLRVNVGMAFGIHALAPALPAFLERHPEVEVELSVTDRLVDLIEENADLGIRTGALRDSSLVARKLCDLERVICASPAYLKRRGTPRKPEDLLKHNCLRLAHFPALWRWPFDAPGGVQHVEVRGNVLASDSETLRHLAIAGAGIARFVDVVVGNAMRDGQLVPVLAQSHHSEPVPLHVVWPQGRHRSPKVSAMVDFLVETFADAPWRTARKAARA
jgi:DNA-binding transcriptional LysR family regulator